MTRSEASGRSQHALPIFLLLTTELVRAALASQRVPLPASLARTGDLASSHTRSIVTDVELNSAGMGLLTAAEASLFAATSDASASAAFETGIEKSALGPQLVNGGFERGSRTDNYQYARKVPGWSAIGRGAIYIKSGSPAFQNIKASHGQYLMGLMGQGSGIYQSVGGHIPGNWYRLIFHAGYRSKGGQAKVKLSVDAAEKFNDVGYSGALGWYEITYKARYPNVVITFEHAGPSGDRTAFIDGVVIKPVDMWDAKKGNARQVLLQKVVCTGYPSLSTCTRGRFLSVGNYDDEGKTKILETSGATKDSVWLALRNGNRWSFKSTNLVQPSPGASGPTRTGDMWFLHADYTSCEARNWENHATSTFNVVMNAMGLHEVNSIGTECGSLFAIQNFENADELVDV